MYQLSQEIGSGKEGRLIKVSNNQDLLAKLYYQPTDQHRQKLLAMLLRSLPQQAHPVIAWPIELLFEKSVIKRQKQFVGFLMPYIHDASTLYTVYHPRERKKQQLQLTKEHLYVIAHNLAYVVATIHQWGYVLGDVNESNFVVNPQLFVTSVDTDSLQFQANGVTTYRCQMTKSEFTPPELSGADLSAVDRTEVHDRFGLATLLFHLLMDGCYPYTGVSTADLDIPRFGLYCKQKGAFPYVKNSIVMPPPNAPPFGHLPLEVQGGFIRSFVYGYTHPERRPSAREWQRILLRAQKNLITCQQNPEHVYGSHLERCPWC